MTTFKTETVITADYSDIEHQINAVYGKHYDFTAANGGEFNNDTTVWVRWWPEETDRSRMIEWDKREWDEAEEAFDLWINHSAETGTASYLFGPPGPPLWYIHYRLVQDHGWDKPDDDGINVHISW